MAKNTMRELTDKEIALLKGKHFAHVATIMSDGSPQVTPVWIDYEDGYIIVNTAEGRVKDRNARRDPRVAISILDESDPYVNVFFTKGRVVDFITEGADASIDALAKKYLDVDVYPGHRDDETRVIWKIAPE